MSTPQPRAIIDAYLDALSAHDYENARTYLAETGFCYQSPISNFSNPDDFMQHWSLSAGIVQRIETLKVFVDGGDLCHFLRFVVQLSERESVKVAQWSRVVDGRIQSLELVFDAYLYRRMFDLPGVHP